MKPAADRLLPAALCSEHFTRKPGHAMCQGMPLDKDDKVKPLKKAVVGAATEGPRLLTVAIVTGIGMAIGTVIGQIIVHVIGLDRFKKS